MDIGTAKVGAADRARVPHHGLDLVDPDEPFTAADYAAHARAALQGIAERDGVALLVGGTGLYVRAIARGLPLERTGHDPALRAVLEARLAKEGLEALARELAARAPLAAASIDPRNPRRVVRALERLEGTGRAVPPAPSGYPGAVLWLALAMEPARHRQTIVERARAQFASGLLDEAAALRTRFGGSARAFSAMGYREAFDVLDGRCDVEAAIATDAGRTWAYARRQGTWFRAEPDVRWLAAGPGAAREAWELVAPFLRRVSR
jgi:tRNA dimethylallyltransferase